MLKSLVGVSQRRRIGTNGIGRMPECCESRVMLSASKIVATAALPEDFSGVWVTTANGDNAQTVIGQSAGEITALFHSSVVNVDAANGKATGIKAKVKYKAPKGVQTSAFVGPPAIKFKMTLTLTGTDEFVGKAKGKTADGKFKLPLEGTRI